MKNILVTGASGHLGSAVIEDIDFLVIAFTGADVISVFRLDEITQRPAEAPTGIMHEFYSVALKRNFPSKMRYGHQDIDFDEGVMHYGTETDLVHRSHGR